MPGLKSHAPCDPDCTSSPVCAGVKSRYANPFAKISSAASGLYGTAIRALRKFTMKTVDEEPKWRRKGDDLLTGYQKTW